MGYYCINAKHCKGLGLLQCEFCEHAQANRAVPWPQHGCETQANTMEPTMRQRKAEAYEEVNSIPEISDDVLRLNQAYIKKYEKASALSRADIINLVAGAPDDAGDERWAETMKVYEELPENTPDWESVVYADFEKDEGTAEELIGEQE